MDDEDLFEEEVAFDARPLWLQLPVRLLNERGKRVVSADPDLRKETMEALMRVHPPKGCYEFYFGNHDFESDVGATGLAMCIADNPLANMAELVARYAVMRKIPFTDTALAVLEQYHTYGLFYYVRKNFRNYPVKRKWFPNEAAIVLPPRKGGIHSLSCNSNTYAMDGILPPPKHPVKTDVHGKRLPDMGNLTPEEYQRRRRAGIERARAEGRLGKKPKPIPESFPAIRQEWTEGKMTTTEASRRLNVCNKTFLKWSRATNPEKVQETASDESENH